MASRGGTFRGAESRGPAWRDRRASLRMGVTPLSAATAALEVRSARECPAMALQATEFQGLAPLEPAAIREASSPARRGPALLRLPARECRATAFQGTAFPETARRGTTTPARPVQASWAVWPVPAIQPTASRGMALRGAEFRGPAWQDRRAPLGMDGTPLSAATAETVPASRAIQAEASPDSPEQRGKLSPPRRERWARAVPEGLPRAHRPRPDSRERWAVLPARGRARPRAADARTPLRPSIRWCLGRRPAHAPPRLRRTSQMTTHLLIVRRMTSRPPVLHESD